MINEVENPTIIIPSSDEKVSKLLSMISLFCRLLIQFIGKLNLTKHL